MATKWSVVVRINAKSHASGYFVARFDGRRRSWGYLVDAAHPPVDLEVAMEEAERDGYHRLDYRMSMDELIKANFTGVMPDLVALEMLLEEVNQ